MRIGDLASAAGCSRETIRYYEQEGVLPRPSRAPNGYRTYDDQALRQLRFIQAAQAAGLTLAEIRSIVELRGDGIAPCAHTKRLLTAKLEAVREHQRKLAALEAELAQLVDRAATLDPGACRPEDICHVVHPGASGGWEGQPEAHDDRRRRRSVRTPDQITAT